MQPAVPTPESARPSGMAGRTQQTLLLTFSDPGLEELYNQHRVSGLCTILDSRLLTIHMVLNLIFNTVIIGSRHIPYGWFTTAYSMMLISQLLVTAWLNHLGQYSK